MTQNIKCKRWFSAPCAGLVLFFFALQGCSSQTSDTSGAFNDATTDHNAAEDTLSTAITNLNRLDEFESSGMLSEVVDDLNNWMRDADVSDEWRADPLLATIPKPIVENPPSGLATLAKCEFTQSDGLALREAIWLRDVSRWARGKSADDLTRARQLFDWTVRNIQLITAGEVRRGEAAMRFHRVEPAPWEVLLFGRGTAIERAWVFILLARQQGIEAALLAAGPSKPGDEPQASCVGVLVEGKIYLFDPNLGLPLPAPNGVKLDAAGGLDVQPATLEQLANDAAVWKQLQLDGKKEPAGVLTPDGARKVLVLVEGSPLYLARRARLLESRMTGKQKAVLSVDLSAQAARWKACAQVGEVRVWLHPYAVAFQPNDEPQNFQRKAAMLPFHVNYVQFGPTENDGLWDVSQATGPLWIGRILYLKGLLVGDGGAVDKYQSVRPASQDLQDGEKRHLDRLFANAQKQFGDQPVPDSTLDMIGRYVRGVRARVLEAKQDASYWLGLLAFTRGQYSSAVDYLAKRVEQPDIPMRWARGVRYNLARSYEALGQRAKAIEVYRQDGPGGDDGQLLRAQWIVKVDPAAAADKVTR